MACTEGTGVGGKTMKATAAGNPRMSIMAIQAKKLPKRKIKKEAADAAEHKSCELVIGSFYVFYFSGSSPFYVGRF